MKYSEIKKKKLCEWMHKKKNENIIGIKVNIKKYIKNIYSVLIKIVTCKKKKN